MKKISIICVFILMAFLLYANGGKEDTSAAKDLAVAKVGFPIVQEKISLKGFGRFDPQHGPWEEMALWKQMEQLTNIHVEWEVPGMENVNERKNLVLASGDLPDFFIKGVITTDDMVKFGSDGALVSLEGFIDDGYTPYFSEALANYKSMRKSLQAPDGHIYGLPRIQDFGPAQVWRSPLLNIKWLEKSGKSLPETIDEFYDLLVYFRDHDMNGNGDVNDEIGYSSHTVHMGFLGIAGIFGVERGLDFDQKYYFKIENGKVINQVGSPEYKQALQFYGKMYQENLLDQEIITHSNKDYFGKLAAGRTGFTPLYQPRNAGTYANDYDSIVPPKGPNKTTYWNYNGLKYSLKPAFVMTSANNYPEATMRWADFFYSEEGADMVYLINENFHDVQADGSYRLKKDILESEIGLEKVMGADTVYPGGGILGWYRGQQMAPGMEGTPMISYIEKTQDYLNDVQVLPILDVETSEKINIIRGDLDTYLDESVSKFINGTLDFDKDWDNFVATMEKLGMSRLEEILTSVF
jgi:putative aldouronate transport system substrate-binding protein